jgi:hypothetical protein
MVLEPLKQEERSLITLDIVFMRETILRDLIKHNEREESEIKRPKLIMAFIDLQKLN